MAAHHQFIEELRAGLRQVLRGKGPVIDLALIGIFAGGHVLLEDVPGVGKATLAKALARVSLAVRLEVGGREPLSRALRRYARARYGVGEASECDFAWALERPEARATGTGR